MSALQDLKISECPAAFADFARKHNALCALIEGMEAGDGITITVTQGNIKIEVNSTNDPGGGGGGIPDGYQEKDIGICEDGSPVEYTFLVKS